MACCVLPRTPHVKPPSGQAPRTQSTAVHRAAAAAAERTGRSSCHSSGTTAPNSAAYAAWLITSGNQPITPNGNNQYRTIP